VGGASLGGPCRARLTTCSHGLGALPLAGLQWVRGVNCSRGGMSRRGAKRDFEPPCWFCIVRRRPTIHIRPWRRRKPRWSACLPAKAFALGADQDEATISLDELWPTRWLAEVQLEALQPRVRPFNAGQSEIPVTARGNTDAATEVQAVDAQ